MGYDKIAMNMTEEQTSADSCKSAEEYNIEYMHVLKDMVKFGVPMKRTLDYLGISPNSMFMSKLLRENTLLYYKANSNIITAASTALEVVNKYGYDMKNKPWQYYDYCSGKYTFQGTDTNFIDIAYMAYKLDKKHKFIEPKFDECIEAVIGLIADTISKIPFSLTYGDIIKIWRLMNVFGNEVIDRQFFEDYIKDAFGNNLTDTLCDLYYRRKNTSQESLLNYVSTYNKYVGLLDILGDREVEEAEMHREYDYRANSKVDHDNIKDIVRQVLEYFKLNKEYGLLDDIVNSFDSTFDFKRGVYDEAIAAWTTLQVISRSIPEVFLL